MTSIFLITSTESYFCGFYLQQKPIYQWKKLFHKYGCVCVCVCVCARVRACARARARACVCVCVASHYTIVQNNSSFMFKYSMSYMPKTNRVLTVSVQVSALDNILMYSYVNNICLYFSLPYWRNINFCFVCFILGRPWI